MGLSRYKVMHGVLILCIRLAFAGFSVSLKLWFLFVFVIPLHRHQGTRKHARFNPTN